MSTLEVDRTSTGNVVIRFRAMVGLSLSLAAIVPLFLIAIVFVTVGTGETGAPPFIYAAFAGFGCIGIVIVLGGLASSKAQITIDRRRSTLIIESMRIRTELPMREVLNAEIASSSVASSGGANTLYRLEFALRNGKRIPATREFNSLYLVEDLSNILKIVNAELGTEGQRIQRIT
jgi:hypothetical protein